MKQKKIRRSAVKEVNSIHANSLKRIFLISRL